MNLEPNTSPETGSQPRLTKKQLPHHHPPWSALARDPASHRTLYPAELSATMRFKTGGWDWIWRRWTIIVADMSGKGSHGGRIIHFTW
ncbi:hypothetical protein TorRG33x02_267970 [Trema orientale]|uniref:Uncharacterized protein n=1 Tax=Trema orientale TaxID=63057 RepID=A0A2P5CZH3_TREOI|nr:hypothetical protein TorRG33x02_267970 [Trema orientale]